MKHLFIRELKLQIKSILYWSVGIFLMIAGGMGKFAGFTASGQDVTLIFKDIPSPVLRVLGFSAFDLTTAAGFFGILALYLLLMAGIHASMLGSDILAKEEKDKTAEFLLVKPITRNAVVTAKLGAGLINLLLFNLITFALSVAMMGFVAPEETVTAEVLVMMAGMFLLQLIFFAIGLGLSASYRFAKSAAGMTAGILLSTFMLSIVVDIYTEVDFLKYFTPFKYFDSKALIPSGGIEPVYLLLSAVLILGGIGLTYVQYGKRDLHV